MHISLDSALGQQRRLNQVGESITQIAPDSAAAYSLRSLTGGDPKVVRVRRGSDNHEQDFTASEVSSGALVDFVNAQVTAPLDIQELTATGRDGDFLIAKAAYSLRSLGTRQATVSATGDTVARADGKYVCQVRRPSDDALKSFTAAEVADGTLLSFVTEEVTLVDATDFSSSLPSPLNTFNSDGSLTSTFGQSIGGSDNTVLFERNSESTSGTFIRHLGTPNIFAGDTVTLTVEVFLPTSNTSTGLTFLTSNLSGGNSRPTQITKGSWQTVTFTGTMSSNASSNNFRVVTWIDASDNNVGAVGEKVYIRKYELKVKSSDGFVKTWYDQSVTTQAGDTATGNHATQATAASQPKIVDAGSLLTKGLTFDGTDDFLRLTSTLGQTDVGSYFSVVELDTTNTSKAIVDNRDSASDGSTLFHQTGSFRFKFLSTTETVASTSTSQLIASAFKTSSKTSLGINGAALEETASTSTISVSTLPTIGGRSFSSAANFMDGEIAEIIIYNTDESDNRTAIEANIGEHYSIDLPSGVDPGFDQVDGFVETWYDQSGNGNNAVQATAANQPKIVNAGTLLNELDFDGSDDQLDFTALNESDLSIFSVANFDDAAGQDRILSTTGGADSSGFGKGSATAGFFRASSGSANQPALNATISADQDIVYSFIRASNTGTFFTNGTASSTFSNSTAFKASAIGGHGSKIDGSLKELIIYDSNQTAKRSSLETNIATQYGITLS